jgi:hypothetical protein
MGREELPSKTHGGEWRFAGLRELLPVYDDLEDGAEVLWRVHGRVPVSRIQRMVKSKRSLSVFDDRKQQVDHPLRKDPGSISGEAQSDH